MTENNATGTEQQKATSVSISDTQMWEKDKKFVVSIRG